MKDAWYIGNSDNVEYIKKNKQDSFMYGKKVMIFQIDDKWGVMLANGKVVSAIKYYTRREWLLDSVLLVRDVETKLYGAIDLNTLKFIQPCVCDYVEVDEYKMAGFAFIHMYEGVNYKTIDTRAKGEKKALKNRNFSSRMEELIAKNPARFAELDDCYFRDQNDKFDHEKVEWFVKKIGGLSVSPVISERIIAAKKEKPQRNKGEKIIGKII